MELFFTGMHHPSAAHRVNPVFISRSVLADRKSFFAVKDWVLDSRAFKTIELFGGYPNPVEEYADFIKRWKDCGNLLAAVTQDYMCEPKMLERTGLTVRDHQRLTVERYDGLLRCETGVYIMPVLQGYAPEDYVEHIRMYRDRLKRGMWVGVGSVCKRNGSPQKILDVLMAIKMERPDLRLHGFGLKTTALGWGLIRSLLYSADSMAWSFAARKKGLNPNDPAYAIAFRDRISIEPSYQKHFIELETEI